jgi:hypothetical protein
VNSDEPEFLDVEDVIEIYATQLVRDSELPACGALDFGAPESGGPRFSE